jgi:hypothetical protein
VYLLLNHLHLQDEFDVYDVEVTRGQTAHGTIFLDVPLDCLLALPKFVAGFSAQSPLPGRGATTYTSAI